MGTTVGERHGPLPALPTVPAVEAWRAMTSAERLSFQEEVNAALTEPAELISKGRPHKKAKAHALDAIGLHFKTTGRVVYLAEEMSVLYPGDKPFSPDVFAVLGVEEPEDDERLSWAVAEEGKGLDLVLEVLHRGDRDKDLADNVERYARLGIPEYFVYDRAQQRIHGFRLPAGSLPRSPGNARYQRILPQLGLYHSSVLDLNLAIIGGRLRFLAGAAELPGSADLIDRLKGMMASVEAQAEEAQRDAATSRALAVLTVLEARGVEVSDAARARILAQKDTAHLQRWLEKAAVATSLSGVLDDPG